jgi:hypothetical protein
LLGLAYQQEEENVIDDDKDTEYSEVEWVQLAQDVIL